MKSTFYERQHSPAVIPIKATSNQTRLCNSVVLGDQAHQQSLDSYCWQLEHEEAAETPNTSKDPTEWRCFNYEEKGHYAHVCPKP
jgi:hypothetical protein